MNQKYQSAKNFSVWAWELADTLLIQNKGKENNHFAATMLRNKIQKEFRELPENSHASLRDSLLKHLDLYREGFLFVQLFKFFVPVNRGLIMLGNKTKNATFLFP